MALGVPGVALGVFYLLLKGFGFKFATIGATWAAVIAIIFLISVSAITLYALHRWAPAGEDAGRKRSFKVGDRVTIVDVPQQTLEGPDGALKWSREMDKFCGRPATVGVVSHKGLPAVKLDVDSGKWWWAVEWLTPGAHH